MAKKQTGPSIESFTLTDLTSISSADLAAGHAADGVAITDDSLDGIDLRGEKIIECSLTRVDLAGAHLGGASFVDVEFNGCFGDELPVSRSNIRGFCLDSCRFGSIDASEGTWQSVLIKGSRLGYVNLAGATAKDVQFTDCRIEELDLSGATAHRMAFTNCTVETLTLHNTAMVDIDLRSASISTIAGIEYLKGTIISETQLQDIAPALAKHLGITIA